MSRRTKKTTRSKRSRSRSPSGLTSRVSRSRNRSRSRSARRKDKDYLDAMIEIAEYIVENKMSRWDFSWIHHPPSNWDYVGGFAMPPILLDRLTRLVEYLEGTSTRDNVDSILQWLIIRVSDLRDATPKYQLRLLQDQREIIEETLTYRVDPYDARSEALRTQLALIERLQNSILKDVSTERLMRGQIGPSRDASRIIQHMMGGEEYKIGDPLEEDLKRLLGSLEMVHNQGYTVEDFFRGVYPEALELYNQLDHAKVYWLQPPNYTSLRGHIEKSFHELQSRDMGQLLEQITELSLQGMTLAEFRSGSGPSWDRLSPDTAMRIKKTYARYRGYSDDFRDLEDEIDSVFMINADNMESALMERIPLLVERGIDFTGLLYGTDPTALEWFENIRYIAGMQRRIQQAFNEAQQNLLQEYMNFVREIAIYNPDVSYRAFLRGEADITNLTESEVQRFRFLHNRVQEFPDYSRAQKQMKSFFRRSRSS